jgi:ABC-type Fe3+-citrate transport system substrate-binding protein
MTEMQDIQRQLDNLTQRVASLELLTGTIGTSQVAIAQILNKQSEHTEILNRHTEDLAEIRSTQALQTQLLNQILQILRDRNGGSGL